MWPSYTSPKELENFLMDSRSVITTLTKITLHFHFPIIIHLSKCYPGALCDYCCATALQT